MRWVALFLCVAAACASASDAKKTGGPLKVGFIYPGPVSDVGWTHQHELARQNVQKQFGDKIETVFVEGVPEGADAERVIRQLASDGCKLIFTTSFGYQEPTFKVAKDFPDVTFEHATGYKMAKNIGIYQVRFYEGAYLQGIIAGKTTKTNQLGFVGSHPIPEVLRNINAFTHGARSVNPDVQLKVIWVNSWYDPGRERAAAETLTNQGADVMYQNTDSPAVMQVAEAKGLHAFGQDSDMSKYGPHAQLTANTLNWGVYYAHKIEQVLRGTWKSEDTKWGMKEDIVQLAPLNESIPPDVVALVQEKKAAIIAGTLQPFGGPVKDQGGAVKVAAGEPLPEQELWSMKWLVDGVATKLP
ncbi:MAG: BMP family ABC transporter substrate-binding protein [Polyangiales bacterium]